jgi:hypothetical protein
MKAFPAAVVASILTERALILECPFDHQAIGISNRIGRFFRGANSIDWSANAILQVHVHVSQTRRFLRYTFRNSKRPGICIPATWCKATR